MKTTTNFLKLVTVMLLLGVSVSLFSCKSEKEVKAEAKEQGLAFLKENNFELVAFQMGGVEWTKESGFKDDEDKKQYASLITENAIMKVTTETVGVTEETKGQIVNFIFDNKNEVGIRILNSDLCKTDKEKRLILETNKNGVQIDIKNKEVKFAYKKSVWPVRPETLLVYKATGKEVSFNPMNLLNPCFGAKNGSNLSMENIAKAFL